MTNQTGSPSGDASPRPQRPAPSVLETLSQIASEYRKRADQVTALEESVSAKVSNGRTATKSQLRAVLRFSRLAESSGFTALHDELWWAAHFHLDGTYVEDGEGGWERAEDLKELLERRGPLGQAAAVAHAARHRADNDPSTAIPRIRRTLEEMLDALNSWQDLADDDGESS